MQAIILPYENLPTESDVQAFEAEFGYTLPSDYRQFLLTYNGGKFQTPQNALDDDLSLCFPGEPVGQDLADVKFHAPRNLWDIALFHGLLRKPGKYGDLRELYHFFNEVAPTELLPIASQIGNAKYFLCVDGPRRGMILFTSYETHRKNEDEEPIDQSDYVCVAKSFSAMFEGLGWRTIKYAG